MPRRPKIRPTHTFIFTAAITRIFWKTSTALTCLTKISMYLLNISRSTLMMKMMWFLNSMLLSVSSEPLNVNKNLPGAILVSNAF